MIVVIRFLTSGLSSVFPRKLPLLLDSMIEESDEPADAFSLQARAFWQARGGRMTLVRRIICQAIAGREAAFIADEIWQQARQRDRGISMASVYRTLADLVMAGVLREIRGPSDPRSFLKAISTSAATGHLICKDCHRITPLDDHCLAVREGAMLRSLGFHTGGMHLQIEAACESLQRCGTCQNRSDSLDSSSQINFGSGT